MRKNGEKYIERCKPYKVMKKWRKYIERFKPYNERFKPQNNKNKRKKNETRNLYSRLNFIKTYLWIEFCHRLSLRI